MDLYRSTAYAAEGRLFISAQLSADACDCSTQQLKQQLWSTLVATQWRGPHCLNIIVLAVVHGLLDLVRVALRGPDDDDDELMLNVLRCHETY